MRIRRRPDAPPSTLAKTDRDILIISCEMFGHGVMQRLARQEDVLLAVGARIVAAGHATVGVAAFREW